MSTYVARSRYTVTITNNTSSPVSPVFELVGDMKLSAEDGSGRGGVSISPAGGGFYWDVSTPNYTTPLEIAAGHRMRIGDPYRTAKYLDSSNTQMPLPSSASASFSGLGGYVQPGASVTYRIDLLVPGIWVNDASARIRAYALGYESSAVETDLSSGDLGTIVVNTAPPTISFIPTLTITEVDGDITITRDEDLSNPQYTYRLEASIDGVQWDEAQVTMGLTHVTSAPAEGVTYYYRVRAEDGVEIGEWSTTASYTTPAAPVPPTTPTLSVEYVNEVLTATRSIDTEGWTYRLEYSTDTEVTWLLETDAMVAEHTVVNAPAPEATYHYRLRAEDAATALTSDWTATVVVTAPAEPEPDPVDFIPTLTITEADGDITIMRDEDASNPAYTYRLEASLDEVQWDLVTDTMGTTHLTGAPAEGVTHYYRARAESGEIVGAWSATASYTTPVPEPEPVVFVPTLSLSASGETITVSRDEDASHPEYTYRLESSTEGREWMLLSSSMGTQFSDVTPIEGETVQYRARAESGTEVGPWSALVSYTTPVTPPPDPEPVPQGAPSEGGATLRIRREDTDEILLEASNWDRDAEVHLLDLGGWDAIPYSNREYHAAALGGGGWFSRQKRYKGRTVTAELSIQAENGLRLRELRAALVEAVDADLVLEVIRTEGGETIIERLGRCVVDDEILWRRTREHVDASVQFLSEIPSVEIVENSTP